MEDVNAINIIKNLPLDLRAETILVDLINQGLDESRLIVKPRGLFERKFSKDLHKLSKKENEKDQEYLLVELNRESIYDSLPEALTHYQDNSKRNTNKSKDEMVEEIKKHREEESAARNFFLPFDDEFFSVRLDIETQERKILQAYQNNVSYTPSVDKFWNLPKILSAKQKSTLLYLFPVLHRITGNLVKTQSCYQAILGVPVQINQIKPIVSKVDSKADDQPLQLGINFVVGHTVHSGFPAIEIVVGPLDETNAQEFLPNAKGPKVLEVLNEYLIPFETDVVVKYFYKEELTDFVLNDNPAVGRMGYSCKLAI
jgi:type VI secretion system protein ImpH